MKFLAIFSLLSITALASNSWYDPGADVTCTGDRESGAINCKSGHLDDAPEVSSLSRLPKPPPPLTDIV